MDKIIAAIKKRIEECKANGIEFKMPAVEGCAVKKCEATIPGHTTFVLELSDGCTVRVDFWSKDGSDMCHYEREVSYVNVECSDHSNDFSDSWDEK